MRVAMKSRIAFPVFAVVTLLLSLAFTSAGSAEEPGLLYGTAAAGTQLVAFNLNAGSVRVIGDIGFPWSAALAFCRPGGRPYTITNMGSASEQLATLDLSTGAATLVGPPLGQNLGIMGLTCSPDGTLYAVGQLSTADPNFNSLYTVDRETGLASRIGSTGASKFLMALDFAPDGTLYGASASSLFRIDTSTGHADKVFDFNGVTTVAGVTRVMGLAIAKDGDFFISDYWPVPPASTVYALDVSTGTATPILSTGLAMVHAIAFKAPGR
jgi:WD40 repeat protein